MAAMKAQEGVRPGLLLLFLLVGALLTLGFSVGLALFLGPKLSSLIPDVPIVTHAPKGMFAPSWFENGGSAEAKGLSDLEAKRAIRVIKSAMEEYPRLLLYSSLNEVHCVSDLTIVGEDFFSINQGDKIYLLNRGSASDSDEALVRRFHYEMAKVLLYQKSEDFDEARWHESLPPGFSYEPDREFPDFKREEDYDLREERWLSQGLLNFAGVWGVEYDLAEIAEGVMTGSVDFYDHVKRRPALDRKARQVVHFYRQLGISLPLWEKEMEGKVGPKP